MIKYLKQTIGHLSFSSQFMLAIIAVLSIGMIIIGSWIGRQIESSELSRAAAMSSVYVESIAAAQLHNWSSDQIVSGDMRNMLDQIFVEGPMHHEVQRFKLWDSSGRIDYSADHTQIGQRFPLKRLLAAAFTGTVQAKFSNFNQSHLLLDPTPNSQQLEVFAPVYSIISGEIVAVAEFYLSVENLNKEIHDAQQRSWAMVAFSTITIYLLLYSLVRRANNTIQNQQRDLRNQLDQLHSALEDNDLMRERLREAGISTTTLNEEFLIRIAADLHDGPAQTIAFALMRFDEFASSYRSCASAVNHAEQDETTLDLLSIKSALESSLRDVRRISSGLSLPGMEDLSLPHAAQRAIFDFERFSKLSIQTEIDEAPYNAPLSVKITVYRLIQESLTNCWKHAPGGNPQVKVHRTGSQVLVTITDHGAGFDPHSAALAGRLGLVFMRERVKLLGGLFEIDSAQGRGTCIRARLPLSTDEMIHD